MRRRLAAPVLVLLALLAVVAVALVPRGLVRAAAAQDLPPTSVADVVELRAAADDVHLPGVRAVLGKEEDDDAGPRADETGGDLPSLQAPAPADAPPTPHPAAGPPVADEAVTAAPGRAPPHAV